MAKKKRKTIKSSNIVDHFKRLKDPRVDRTKVHLLMDIIVITLCATICGADTWVDIQMVGVEKYEWFKTFLKLPCGIPSHDTFGRVMSALDPAQFKNYFLGFSIQ